MADSKPQTPRRGIGDSRLEPGFWMTLPRTMNTGGFVTSRKWGFIEIKILKNWMKARVPRDDKPGFHLEYGPTATSMAGRLQCVACVIPWKMVCRKTGGVGTQLRPVSPDTSLFARRLSGLSFVRQCGVGPISGPSGPSVNGESSCHGLRVLVLVWCLY